MADLIRLGAAELSEALSAGQTSAVEATQAHLDRIAAVDGEVGAFLHVAGHQALATAKRIDERRVAGEPLGPLAGVPVAVKDAFVTRGVPTTAGSKILDGWLPPYESTATTRLADAGAVMIGKTNMDEFAMGSTTENSAFKPARNPWNLERVPGGSSGGSATAVAAFEAPLALGTDTGGSIRQPAALTGIVGMKPTYGSVSRYGVIAFSSSLDTPGPFGRSVLDVALLHATVAGHDRMDSTSIDAPVPAIVDAARTGASADLTGVRVGIVQQLHGEGLEPGVETAFAEAVELLRTRGAQIVDVSCPHFPYGVAAYYLIAPSEASSNLARYDSVRYGLRLGDDGRASLEEVMAASREGGFGPEVKRRIILGTYALSAGYVDAFYNQALKVRTLIARDFEAAYEQVDVLISPTAPTVAYPLGRPNVDPLAVYRLDLTTLPSSLAGTPALSVPIALSDDPNGGPQLPVGLQVMAPALRDDVCYRVGAAVESAVRESRGEAFLNGAPAL